MRKTKVTAVLSLLLATVLLLAGCGDPDRLEYDNDNRRYVREGDGAVFYRASANYLAVRIRKGDEVGSIGQVDADDIPLYVIADYADQQALDPDRYMADADYNVYYAEGVVLPKLWEMEIDLIRIVETATQSYSVGAVDDAATVERVIALYQNGFSVPYTDADCNFRVKELESERLAFSSEKYGGFYYVLQYYRFEESVTLTREVEDFDSFAPTLDFPYALEEHNGRTYVRYDMGKNFLHDPATGLCYPTGTLLDSYYHNAN